MTEKIKTNEPETAAGVAGQSGVACSLLPCPCGKTPATLNIVENGQGGKYALVDGDCCGEWSVAFRACYAEIDSTECMKYAVEAWNRAPRGKEARKVVWFDIEELKPELNTWCFVSDGSGTHFAAYMDGLGFLGTDGEAFEGYITHWMPLPPAPDVKE